MIYSNDFYIIIKLCDNNCAEIVVDIVESIVIVTTVKTHNLHYPHALSFDFSDFFNFYFSNYFCCGVTLDNSMDFILNLKNNTLILDFFFF